MCQFDNADLQDAAGPPRSTGAKHVISPVRLQRVENVDVTILVDNTSDILLPSTERVERPKLAWDWSEKPQLIAEHGYALLLTTHRKGAVQNILYDAGLSPDTITHNLSVLGVKLADLDAVVLSHGHADHHGGLLGIARHLGKKNLPLILHPAAWKERKLVFPSGTEIHMPPPKRRDLETLEVQVRESEGPSFLISDHALVTGQVERVTSYEKGLPIQYAATKDGGWEHDPWTWDDQGIIFHVNGKGLIVLSSCSHSGVVNVIQNAKRITSIEKVFAFVGGMHLSGGIFEKIIPETMRDLAVIKPQVIMPGHCTGWKATHLIAREMPEAFVQSSVGTTIRF